ncbi:MAG: sigma-70 family RNA polymerase sigma factor [Dehalococcoidia bacterium]|jgi:RNA polymerase primary sigma factor
MVLKSADNIEQLLAGEELYILDEGIGEEGEFPGGKSVPTGGDVEPIGDSMDLYLLECRRTRLLTANEEKTLGSSIEDGRYLSEIDQELEAKNGYPPSETDLLLELMRRLCRTGSLLRKVSGYLKLRLNEGIQKTALNSKLRGAIDGKIDEHLLDAISRATGSNEVKALHDLTELSVVTRLIPWNIVRGWATCSSITELGRVVNSTKFQNKLGKLRPKIALHFEQIRQKSQEATRQLTQSNLRLVVSVAKKYKGYGMPLGDLVQEGNIGLMRAVEKFDHRRGCKFSTYAHWWIRQAVGRAISDQVRTVRLPIHMADNMTRLVQSRQRLYQRFGRQPTTKELAAEMHISPEKLEWLQKVNASKPISLETPIGDEGGQLSDFVEDHVVPKPAEEATTGLLRDQLGKTLESLPARERRIIEMRFGLDNGYCRTLEEVGVELGLTRERIRQLEKEALAKLRHPKLSRQFVDYLS